MRLTDHKTVGLQYGVTALLFLLVGFLLMILMRWQLAWPGQPLPAWLWPWLGEANAPGGIMLPEFYNQLVAMHGSVMVFLAVVPLAAGAFANYFVPLQVGAGEMAFPRLNAASYWISLAAGVVIFLISGFYHPGDLLFIDLETLGLFSRPIILFGLAEIRSGELWVSQYLLRDISEELPALSAVFDQLTEDRVIVSYNGKAFDIPYLAGRSAFYGRPAAMKNPHYDLLHFARKRWRDDLPDCWLVTLEQRLLGTGREDDIPGAMVPEFYEAFMTTGNPDVPFSRS